MQNGGECLTSIILVVRGILVKMLIALEAQGILIKFCKLIHFNIIETGMQNGDEALPRVLFVAKPSHCFAYLCLGDVAFGM